MGRYAGFFIVVMLLSFCCGAVAEEEKPSNLKYVSEELCESVRQSPVSFISWMRIQLTFLTEITKKLIESGKPMVGFIDGERIGLEISFYEEGSFNLTAGKFFKQNEEEGEEIELEKEWFFGLEFRGLPLVSNTSEIFKRLCPQVLLYKQRVWFGLAYEFKE